jgi:hypothetical protein
MSNSQGARMSGHELFNILVQNTGLPEDYVKERFESLIQENGGSIENLSLENVRELLADLILDLISESTREPV